MEPRDIEEAVIILKDTVPRIEDKVDTVVKLLQGDNSAGLITRVALLKQSVNRAWWWLGSISLFMLAVIGKWVAGK